ncbi:L-aminoadipate-semialdehyde dehydrogenase-phosphopantetheinyl transferase-like [Branchiostoma lanceolatum]|uniref:L-aminoadipate-semialdehyde dehydrogenase-phosphopantetheinyl transferase-like n=1 Tax=Branchiostoma lanceolatum TaxID=7740 RepID=UPI0034532709
MKVNASLLMSGMRWAMKTGLWQPSREEWLLAARCVQQEEKDRINKFVFAKDAKYAMAGRLLIRKAVSDQLGIQWKDVQLGRTEKGKPYLTNTVDNDDHALFSFNVSHSGDYAVLAAEHKHVVGVDVMKVDYPNRGDVPEFFRMMRRQFTDHEWSTIKTPNSEWEQLKLFYRHWCLKESYVKALGVGIGFELQRIDFHLKTPQVRTGEVSQDTQVYIDGTHQPDWLFQESALDDTHCAAVAIQGLTQAVSDPPPFRVLEFSELTGVAQPLLPEDVSYWESFRNKKERPQLTKR